MEAASQQKLSLIGSVSLGTGVMIGAGIFALVGQVAELAGGLVPEAFLFGAIIVGFSSYSYARYSSTNPSSGGIAMQLKAAYGPGILAGSFSFFMYVSMVVAESLLARTFGTYFLRPFGLQNSVVLVPALGVTAIVAAALVNLWGTKLVERSATVTAAVKIIGIAVLAVAGLIAAGPSALGSLLPTAGTTPPEHGIIGFLSGATLGVLAYKGFTTITNQGADIRQPKKTIGRSIMISIALCAVIYLVLTLSVTASLDVPQIIEARDYALAEAAEPLFGAWGVRLIVALAVVATLSGLLASLYSVSRLYEMLQRMGQAPSLPARVPHQPLVVTAGLAILVTVLFDLSQIASMGAILYLSMDIAIQLGVVRHLADDIAAKRWIPMVSIALNTTALSAFLLLKIQTDLLTVVVAAAAAALIFLAQWYAVRQRERNTSTTRA